MKKFKVASILLAVGLLYGADSYGLIEEQPADVNSFITTAKCENCDLSMINLNSLMVHEIYQSNNENFYVGSDLKGAALVGSIFFGTSLNMQNSNFDLISGSKTDFTHTKLDNSTFINAILENAVFVGADLERTNFSGSDLKGANFDGADLTGSNITLGQLNQVSHCNTTLPDGTIATSCTSTY